MKNGKERGGKERKKNIKTRKKRKRKEVTIKCHRPIKMNLYNGIQEDEWFPVVCDIRTIENSDRKRKKSNVLKWRKEIKMATKWKRKCDVKHSIYMSPYHSRPFRSIVETNKSHRSNINWKRKKNFKRKYLFLYFFWTLCFLFDLIFFFFFCPSDIGVII